MNPHSRSLLQQKFFGVAGKTKTVEVNLIVFATVDPLKHSTWQPATVGPRWCDHHRMSCRSVSQMCAILVAASAVEACRGGSSHFLEAIHWLRAERGPQDTVRFLELIEISLV